MNKTALEKLGIVPFDPIGRTALDIIGGKEVEERTEELKEEVEEEVEEEPEEEIEVATKSRGAYYPTAKMGSQMSRVMEALAGIGNPTKKTKGKKSKEEIEEVAPVALPPLPPLPKPTEVAQVLAPLREIFMMPHRILQSFVLPGLAPIEGRKEEAPEAEEFKIEEETEEPEEKEVEKEAGEVAIKGSSSKLEI